VAEDYAAGIEARLTADPMDHDGAHVAYQGVPLPFGRRVLSDRGGKL